MPQVFSTMRSEFAEIYMYTGLFTYMKILFIVARLRISQ